MKKLAGLLAVMILTLSMACLFTSCSNKIKVSFVQDGQTTIVKTIDKGQTLTDIPAPVQKTGYTVSWEVADFSNLQKEHDSILPYFAEAEIALSSALQKWCISFFD